MKKLAACIIVSMAIVTSGAIANDQDQKIVIGVAAPMSGQMAIFGEEMKQAAELVAQKINPEGGILGSQVVLEIEDNANQPQQAVASQ